MSSTESFTKSTKLNLPVCVKGKRNTSVFLFLFFNFFCVCMCLYVYFILISQPIIDVPDCPRIFVKIGGPLGSNPGTSTVCGVDCM